MLVVEDAGKACAGKKHVVGCFGVWAACLECAAALQEAVVIGGLTLEWQEVLPDFFNPLVFGEEAVPADIDIAAVMVHGAGKAADKGFLLDDDGMDVGCLEKFVSGGKACGACADDNRGLQEDSSLIQFGIPAESQRMRIRCQMVSGFMGLICLPILGRFQDS